MKKLNKVLACTMAIPVLAVVAPTLTITSCAKDKPYLSFDGEKTIVLDPDQTTFTLTLNSRLRLRSTDVINTEVEVTDLEAAKGSTVTLTFDAEESSKNDGQFAVFNGKVGKEDGSAPEDGTVVKFDVKFNFKRESDKFSWSETMEGFEVDYSQQSECDIELVEGQEDMYTQPGLVSQYYVFNLNHTDIPENAGIGGEVSVVDTHGNVSSATVGTEGTGIEYSYQEGNKLFVWFKLVSNGKAIQVGDYAKFTIRLFCWDKVTQSVVWQKSFDNELKLSFLGQEVAVAANDRNGTKADHDAGFASRTYKLFHDPDLGTEFMPSKDNEVRIDFIEKKSGITGATWECNDYGQTEAGMPYWNLTINFTTETVFVEDDAPSRFYVYVNKVVEEHTIIQSLGEFSYYYVSKKLEFQNEKQDRRTPENYNYGVFDAKTINNSILHDGDYIRFDITPTDPSSFVYARYYYLNAKLKYEDQYTSISSYIELSKTGAILHAWDSASFYVTYVCYNKDNEKVWSQTITNGEHQRIEHKLTKFVTPIKIISDKEQIIYPNQSGTYQGNFSFELATNPDSLKGEKIEAEIEKTGSTLGKTIEIAPKQPEIIIQDKKTNFNVTMACDSELQPGDFVEFKVTFKSTGYEGHEWSYVVNECRLEVGEGLTLDTVTTIRVTAKEYEQTALKNAETIAETKPVPQGTTTTVTINTSDWPETELPDYSWILGMPHDPAQGLNNFYIFDVASIVYYEQGSEDGRILTRSPTYDPEGEGDYFVSSGGPITIYKKLGLKLGDKLVYTLTLLNEDITKPTNFYWTLTPR